MSVKIGISPIAWQNDDLPELKKVYTMEQALQEAREIGYTGVERGQRMPHDPNAPPIGPNKTANASALSNNAEIFVTCSFLTTSPRKALQVVQCAISNIPNANANGISIINVNLSLIAKYPIRHIKNKIMRSKLIINCFLGNLSARTPPNGPVRTPTIPTVNKIDDNALALPVVSNIQTPIAKKDIAEPVQDKV